MMVAEFIDRQNSSPINGETPHHSNGSNANVGGSTATTTTHGSSPTGASNPSNNGNNSIGCPNAYCYMESNDSIGMATETSSDADVYSNNYDMNGHLPRKDLFSQRKQREFIPDNKKDESYWDRRRRNNEAAKRSREKRRYNDMILEQRVVELSKENHFLKAQLSAIKDKYGISGESVVNVEQVMATLPTNDQVLSITKRAKLNPTATPILYQPNSVPIPTPVIHKASSGPSPPLVPLHPIYRSESNDGYPEAERYPFPFPPVLPPLEPPVLESSGNSVLNLSLSRVSPGPYGLSLPPSEPPSLVTTTTGSNAHNNLPHKLRHKSHLGDKDVAATALLSLHNIKQEPGSRASPPWDGEGSSDERDSGISLGAEWMVSTHNVPDHTPPHDCIENEDDESHLKSEVARLASEVASLKSLLSRKKTTTIAIN